MSHFAEVFASAVRFTHRDPALIAFAFILGALLFLPAVIYRQAFLEESSFLHLLRTNRPMKIPEFLYLALGGVLSALAVMKLGFTLGALTVLLLFAVLAAVTLVDAALMIIPDRFVVALLVLSALSVVFLPTPAGEFPLPWYERLIGCFSIALPMFLLTLLVPDAFGGGDIKMMAAVGILLGWRLSLVATLFAILSGGLYGVYVLLRRKKGRSDVFAFGPFLCAGIVFSLLLGEGFIAFGQFLHDYYFAFPL